MIRRRRNALALAGVIAGALLVVACATTLTLQQRRIDLASALKFSHKRHKGEAECSDCHGAVADSGGPTRGQFIGKPTDKAAHGGCVDCHEVKEADKCKMCHVGAQREVQLTRLDRRLSFSHAAHKSRVKAGCKGCHPGVASATRPGEDLVGPMATCTDACHKQDLRQQRCDLCHRDMQRFAVAAVGKLAHGGDFIKRHGALARNAQPCAKCHDQTKCADCHARTAPMKASIRFPERTDARYIHRGDYLGRHAAEARAQPASCRKCHGAQFCSTCHEQAGISVPTAGSGTAVVVAGRQVHGADNMTPGAPGFHGRQARRDINRCASCHDRGAGSNCVKCHKVGQLGGNPHPASFRWRDKRTECRTNTMCATCHTAGAGCP